MSEKQPKKAPISPKTCARGTGQKWVKNAKSDRGQFGTLKQLFLAHFEHVVTHFGPWKIPKCLENGSCWDQKRIKAGSPVAARGDGVKWGSALPKPRSFGPKAAIFGPQKPPDPGATPKGRETVATPQVRLDLTVSKSPLPPFNSTIRSRNGPKRRQKSPKSAQCAPPETNHGSYLGLCASTPNYAGT